MATDKPVQTATYSNVTASQRVRVAIYAAAFFALITILHLLLRPMAEGALRWLLTLLMAFMVVANLLEHHFSGFRLRIVNAAHEDITQRMGARLIAYWGLFWRSIVCFIPFSILFGLGGAMIVVVMTQFPIVMHSWLIYPVSFLCLFSTCSVLSYLLFWWWFSMAGGRVRIVAAMNEADDATIQPLA